MKASRQRFWAAVVGWALAVGLYGLLVAVTAEFHFRYPFSDEWTFIPFVDSALRGELTWRDYWAPHHGHRLVIPRLVLVANAAATHWDPRWVVGLNLGLGAAIFAFLSYVLSASLQTAGTRTPWFAPPLLALLVFSLNQWCNWAWGWQVQIYLSIAFSVAGIASLSGPRPGVWRIGLAVACGVGASLSFATGVVYWGAGLLMLLFPLVTRERPQWTAVGVWVGASLIMGVAYVTGFTHPEYHGTGTFLPSNPWVVIPYTAIYMGGCLAYFQIFGDLPLSFAALPVGIAGLAAGAWALVWLARQGVPARALAPLTGLMAFGLGSAVMTGLARSAHYGARQAAVARYFTISELYWAGLIGLLLLVLWKAGRHGGQATGKGWLRAIVAGGLVLMAGLMALSSRQGYFTWDEHCQVYLPEARRMVVQDLEEVPARLNPTHHSLEEELALLKKWELFCFRPAVRDDWSQD